MHCAHRVKNQGSHLALSSLFFFCFFFPFLSLHCESSAVQMLKAYQLASFKGHENGLIKIQKVDKVCNQRRQRRLPFSSLFAFSQI